jgi:hypothetical protein
LAGLGPAIHAFERRKQGVDARIKSAQDDLGLVPARTAEPESRASEVHSLSRLGDFAILLA